MSGSGPRRLSMSQVLLGLGSAHVLPIKAAADTGSQWPCRNHPAHFGCIRRWAVPLVGSSSTGS